MIESDASVGRTIAKYRKNRGLTQPELAHLIDRSEAWVSQVERNVRPVKTLDVIERIAAVLNIPLSELAPTAPKVAAEEVPLEAVPLRLLLSANFALRARVGRPGSYDVEALERESRNAWQLTHDSRYKDLVQLLESLFPRLEFASLGDSSNKVSAALAHTYQACAAALAKLQQFDAAWVAADRAIAYAGRADDPVLMGEGAFRLTLIFQGARQFDQAEYTASTARTALDSLVSQGNLEAASVYGALTLQLAVVSARIERATEAWRYLDEARTTAERLGADRNDYNTEFGPTNVQLHEVAVAVELGDAGEAIRRAERIDASTLSAERRARLLIDVGRAWTQRRNVGRAVAALDDAAALTPEQVYGDDDVHRMVSDLLRYGDSAPLRDLARRAGVSGPLD